ncbi:MAG: DUF4258 domain-containing protein [Bacteroidota bacterium]
MWQYRWLPGNPMRGIKCAELRFIRHAVQQMFARSISEQAVTSVVKSGEVISAYPDNCPYPGYLLFCYIGSRSLHVVVALNPDDRTCIVVTAYEPSSVLWGRISKSGYKA